MSEKVSGLPVLNQDNYEYWCIQMKSSLTYQGIWGYIDGSQVKPDKDKVNDLREWNKNDSKAHS